LVLKKIGLTGATGMLGQHLKATFRSIGTEVVALSRSGANGTLVWDQSKWLGLDALDKIFTGCNVICHSGAATGKVSQLGEQKVYDTNVGSCLNLGLWALSRDIPLIYISGAIVYADPYASYQSESGQTGWNALGGYYGFSKLLGERILSKLREQGLRLCILRPSSIYGYGLPKQKMVTRLINAAARNETVEINEPLNQRIDLVHASDVAAATLSVIKNEFWGTINVSAGKTTSITEIAEACLNVTGKGVIVRKGLPNHEEKIREIFSLNIELAGKEIQWAPKIEISAGLAMMIRQQYVPTT
jgi:UDP-glucose 4-epimerase